MSTPLDDPIQRHPTRSEQLDILVTLLAEQTGPGDRVLDLGCGTGYVAQMLLARTPDIRLTGIDVSADALAQVPGNLGPHAARFDGIAGDLNQLAALGLSGEKFRAIYTCLTFHDLSHDAKQAVITWSAEHLLPGGYLLIYDRIRLTAPGVFPLQTNIWQRIERVHGRGMRAAETFADYEADLGPTNNPASLSDYLRWMDAADLGGACVHLHGNIALFAGAASSEG
tara:strand:- start:620 stop:1297 length:678 start_codon:yes stop_codon:yes gene_type:complete